MRHQAELRRHYHLVTSALDGLTDQFLAVEWAVDLGDADISGFGLNALASGLPLNVDLDTTLTVLAGNAYRLLARKLPRYEQATPDRLWRHFLDNTAKLTVADDHIRVDLNPRTYTPVLIDAGYPELDLPIPWWQGRTLRFGFPPR